MALVTGKIGENVRDRSIKKRLGKWYQPEGLGDQTLQATDCITMRVQHPGRLAVLAACNDLAAAGGVPKTVETVVLLPRECEEQTLRGIEDEIAQTLEEISADGSCHPIIVGGHTEVTAAVTRPIVTVSVTGEPITRPTQEPSFAQPLQIVMSKWTALEGTYLLATEKNDDLSNRFALQLLERAKATGELLSVLPEMLAIEQQHIPYQTMVNVSEGGVYAALWKISQAMNRGIRVSLPAIPILQETIEIFNHYELNPYQAESAGSLLCVTPDAGGLVRAWNDAGIHAAVIGTITEDRDKILVNDDEQQNLNLPAPDALLPILG